MSKKITIVDYGLGNLYSVRRAVEVSGAEDIVVSDQPIDLFDADKIILPGVGAFKDGMKGLRDRGLIEPLIDAARNGKPILGICLGMQLLANSSEEFGFHQGLSLISGKVKPLIKLDTQGNILKIPYIGWSPLNNNKKFSGKDLLLAGTLAKSVYLVHSYQFIPDDPTNTMATYSFGGREIAAVVNSGNVTGVQFHPEKSGPFGLQLIKRFVMDYCHVVD